MFVSAPDNENTTVVSVYIDNNGYRPQNTYLPNNRQVLTYIFVLSNIHCKSVVLIKEESRVKEASKKIINEQSISKVVDIFDFIPNV